MTVGQWILVVTVVLAVGFGAWRARTDGRFKGAAAAPGREEAAVAGEPDAVESAVESTVVSVVAGSPFAGALGERATFLQFSSAFCAPCRVTRRTLEEVTELLPDVAHVEVDAELHLELVRRLDVLRTPTTLVLDAAGREVTRAAGAPTKHQVLQALALVEKS